MLRLEKQHVFDNKFFFFGGGQLKYTETQYRNNTDFLVGEIALFVPVFLLANFGT